MKRDYSNIGKMKNKLPLYKIGNDVWFIDCNHVHHDKIYEIISTTTSIYGSELFDEDEPKNKNLTELEYKHKYKLCGWDDIIFDESKLFKTKQDLLNSL